MEKLQHLKQTNSIQLVKMAWLPYILLGGLYFIVSLHQLYSSSLPKEPCMEGDDCMKPLLYYHQQYKKTQQFNESLISTSKDGFGSNSTFVLELLVPMLTMNKLPDGRQQPSFQWTKISSCSTSPSAPSFNEGNSGMSFEIDDYLANEYDPKSSPTLGRSHNPDGLLYNTFMSWLETKNKPFSFKSLTINHECQLSFPKYMRIRSQNPKVVHPLKGKFVLKQLIDYKNNQTNVTIAETSFDLTRVLQKKKEQNENEKEYVPHFKYYKQPLVLRVVTDTQSYPEHNPFRRDGYEMDQTESELLLDFDTSEFYNPIFYVDDVALRHRSQVELAPQTTNEKPPVSLKIKLSFIKPVRHVIQSQITLGLRMAEKLLKPNELDELRYLISDEYMYKFVITQIIGFLHLALDSLAFKNEIGFYVGKGKDVTGISLSSLYSRCICNVIIFLYLVDGGKTSWFVLLSIGLSILVELWKLYKFLQPKWNWKNYPHCLSFRDMSSMSSTEQLTIDYDSVARAYLSMILYPLVLGMAVYGRQFYTYRSVYSWVISNLANAVYTFGFISLCPQLYINYKLKSVAHLPWRVFVYKIFNTFVDDVFAFLIEMPLKHKIMTLRDDVVFFVFLVQAYIYRVDKKRANEYGYVYDNDEDEKAGKKRRKKNHKKKKNKKD